MFRHDSVPSGQDAPGDEPEFLSLTDDLGLPPGTAHLLREINKRLLFYLRDGRTFIGTLKSIDQFGNVVLDRTVERIYVGLEYGDIDRGLCVLRGENLVIVGEWDSALANVSGAKRKEISYILRRQMEQEAKKKREKNLLHKAMRAQGLSVPVEPDDDYFLK